MESWKCIENCGACCKFNLDERSGLADKLSQEDIDLINSMTGKDGWCKNLDRENKNFKIVQFSLLTGFFIGLYSLVDGYGARASLSPIVYMSWSFILSAALFPIILKIKNHNNIIQKVYKNGKLVFWVGGSLSFIIYTIVVWAFTKAPIPMVGALRESSIFFSIFIGYFFLKEKITPTKICSIVLILVGVTGLKIF